MATSRQEALAALAQYLGSTAAAQLSRQGQNVLIDIVSSRIARREPSAGGMTPRKIPVKKQ